MAAENIRAVKATVGRIIGVDFGEVRTGVAVSDEARLLASGIGFIKVGGLHKTADKIQGGGNSGGRSRQYERKRGRQSKALP